MSSVRPIIEAEEMHGAGQPLVSYCAFFGLTSGLMTHMKMHGLTASQNWFPNSRSRATGLLLIGGGLVGGYYAGRFLFAD